MWARVLRVMCGTSTIVITAVMALVYGWGAVWLTTLIVGVIIVGLNAHDHATDHPASRPKHRRHRKTNHDRNQTKTSMAMPTL